MPLRVGDADVTDVRVGAAQASAMYLGSTLVWTAGSMSVLAENALAGTTGWWKPVAPWNLNLLGFATATNAEAGTTVDFKVSSAGVPYTLDIYRLGSYSGIGARLVASLSNDGSTQSDGTLRTNGEGAQGSRDCSAWTVTDSWTVPEDQTHGVYLPVLKGNPADNTTWFYLCPFTVSNTRSRAAPVLVVFSDMTWHAYNSFGTLASPNGGKSVYGIGGGNFSQGGRAWDVSYNRPLIVLPTSEGSGATIPQTSWANGEMPVWEFLERNGVEVAYASQFDIDADPTILAGRQVLVMPGHNEYWSQKFRDAWDSSISNGASALILSGNTLLWRTRMGTADAADQRRMYCYKNSHSLSGTGSGIDPVSWTGTWRDTRWSSRNPENTSIGSLFIANGVRSDTPSVPFSMKDLELWRHTTVPALTTGQSRNLKAGALGMEWDTYSTYYANCQSWPSRLKLCSLATVGLSGNVASENGEVYNETVPGGNVNHHVTAYPTGVGDSFVVNFGADQWGWGLSNFHCRGGSGENADMQQALVNCLVDMGVTVPNLMPTLTAPTPTTWAWPTIGSISVTPSSDIAFVDDTQHLKAVATWSSGITSDVTKQAAWSSSATGIATVGASTGIVTGVAEGNATITATFLGQTDTCDFTVVEGIALTHVYNGTNPTADITDVNDYEMGTQFSLFNPIQLAGARIWNPGAVTLTRTIRLWNDDTNVQIASWPCPSLLNAGWTEVVFDDNGIALTTGVNYILSYNVDGPNDYGAALNALSPDVTDSNVLLGLGVYSGTPASIPDATTQNFYGVDVLYHTGILATLLVAPSVAVIVIDGTQQLTATHSEDGSVTTLATWGSSNTAIATVSSTGLVTGIAEGTCTITGTYDGLNDTCAVTVTETVDLSIFGTGAPATSVALYADGGGSIYTGVRFYTTRSDGATIIGARVWNPASADSTFLNTDVTVRAYLNDWGGSTIDGSTTFAGSPVQTKTSTELRVADEWTDIFFDSPITLPGIGGGTGVLDLLTIAAGYAGGAYYIFCTRNDGGVEIESVYNDDVFVAANTNLQRSIHNLGTGSGNASSTGIYGVDIIYATGSGPPILSVTPATASVEVGLTQQLVASLSGTGDVTSTATWGSSSNSVATVSSTGLVTAAAEGSCTITATYTGGYSDTCDITVIPFSDTKWVNRTFVQSPRNGTTTHTINFTPATEDNVLVAIGGGPVTFSTPTGWARPARALENVEMRCFTKVASFSESAFTVTAGSGNYPLAFVVYEFPAGYVLTYAGDSRGAAAVNVGLGCYLTSSTDICISALMKAHNDTTQTTEAVTWDAPTVEDLDVFAPASGTAGYYFAVGYAEDQPVGTWVPTITASASSTPNERIAIAMENTGGQWPLWVGVVPSNSGDAGAYEMGTYFNVYESVDLTAVRIMATASTRSGRNATLWRSTNPTTFTSPEVVATIDIPDTLVTGMNITPFDYSIIDPGLYCISYNGSGNYYAVSPGYFDNGTSTANTDQIGGYGVPGVTTGYGAVVAQAGGGRFNTTVGSFPATEFGNGYYGVDVLYERHPPPT